MRVKQEDDEEMPPPPPPPLPQQETSVEAASFAGVSGSQDANDSMHERCKAKSQFHH